MKVYVADEQNKNGQFMQLPVDTYRNRNDEPNKFIVTRLNADPRVSSLRDDKGQIFYKMSPETFQNYLANAPRAEEIGKLYDALAEKQGSQSPVVSALAREFEFWGGDLDFLTTVCSDITRVTAFKLFSTEELKALNFKMDAALALWSADNELFDKAMVFTDPESETELFKSAAPALAQTLLITEDKGYPWLRYVLDKTPETINAVDSDHRNLLHWAILYKKDAAIDLLLEKGVNVNALAYDDSINKEVSALQMHVERKGSPEITKKLLDAGAEFMESDILDYAVRHGDYENLKVLLDSKPNSELFEVLNVTQPGLLDAAARSSLSSAAKIADLLIEKGAIQDDYDQHGHAPIHSAIFNRDNPEVAKVLIDHWLESGHSLLEKDDRDLSLFEHARSEASHVVVQHMLDKAPELTKKIQEEQALMEKNFTPSDEDTAALANASAAQKELRNKILGLKFIASLSTLADIPKPKQREAIKKAVDNLNLDICREVMKEENRKQMEAAFGNFATAIVTSSIQLKLVFDKMMTSKNEQAVPEEKTHETTQHYTNNRRNDGQCR